MSATRSRRQRGFTLIELMTAAAIGLVVVTAAMAMFTGLRQMMEDTDRSLVTVSDLQMGTTSMQRYLENAGTHFPSPRTAMTIRQNIPVGTLSNGQAYFPPVNVVPRKAIDLSQPKSTWVYTAADEGIVAGTDVIEMLSGTSAGNMVQVQAVLALGGPDYTVTFQAPTNVASTGPDVLWYPTGGNKGPVLLFRNSTTECIGMVISEAPPNNKTKFNIRMLGSDFEPDPAPPAGCPAAGTSQMNVYRLGGAQQTTNDGGVNQPWPGRVRFMVYQQQGETHPMLVMQKEADPAMTPGFDSAGILDPAIIPLAEGIEDMQVAELLQNSGGLCGAQQMCICDDPSQTTPCLLNQTPAGNGGLMRGVHLLFTSRGQFDVKRPNNVEAVMPAAYDRVAGPVDGIMRQQFRMAVMSYNFNPQIAGFGGTGGGGP
jgi:prepilin-type N-terminal cleavage/methylation domain-containing protein